MGHHTVENKRYSVPYCSVLCFLVTCHTLQDSQGRYLRYGTLVLLDRKCTITLRYQTVGRGKCTMVVWYLLYYTELYVRYGTVTRLF
jgi:hypothetical protein